MSDVMTSFCDLLTRWGVWSRTNPTQGVAPIKMWDDGTGKGDMDNLDDETAMLLDRCVLALKQFDAEAYEVIKAKYVYRGTVRKIAEVQNLPKYVVCELIKRGELFLWGYYEGQTFARDLTK